MARQEHAVAIFVDHCCATRNTVVKAGAVGVTQFIAKPFNMDRLMAKIRGLLAH